LCKLLQNAVAKSDWDIVLELPTLLVPAEGGDSSAPKTVN
jgi:hypothetical protein